jgi:hypothetical protein
LENGLEFVARATTISHDAKRKAGPRQRRNFDEVLATSAGRTTRVMNEMDQKFSAEVHSNDGDLAEAWLIRPGDGLIEDEIQIGRNDCGVIREEFLAEYSVGREFVVEARIKIVGRRE